MTDVDSGGLPDTEIFAFRNMLLASHFSEQSPMNNASHPDFENAIKDALRPQIDAVIASLDTELGSRGLKGVGFILFTAEAGVQAVDESAG